ncbi:unnamed protein product [Pleuronectes platessa]|uniref:Uncharacterized protein n=1 Tax=Pleuronectes platessa TaxID=8262 RepID=A0A9N7Z4G9_PLEPL|nr:unnamed protein product [Pleuronectes platessa]
MEEALGDCGPRKRQAPQAAAAGVFSKGASSSPVADSVGSGHSEEEEVEKEEEKHEAESVLGPDLVETGRSHDRKLLKLLCWTSTPDAWAPISHTCSVHSLLLLAIIHWDNRMSDEAVRFLIDVEMTGDEWSEKTQHLIKNFYIL